jgi:hypothetical protein
MSLHVLAYNLKRVMNILGTTTLMEAMVAWWPFVDFLPYYHGLQGSYWVLLIGNWKNPDDPESSTWWVYCSKILFKRRLFYYFHVFTRPGSIPVRRNRQLMIKT